MREGSTMQLNRCFADMLGYIKTIETLEELRELKHLQAETKDNLMKKILNLVKAIVTMKASSSIQLSREEKDIYKDSMRKYVYSNANIFFLYYAYSTEYKLRILKKRLVDLINI